MANKLGVIVRLSEGLIEQVDKWAQSEGRSRNAGIMLLIEKGLREQEVSTRTPEPGKVAPTTSKRRARKPVDAPVKPSAASSTLETVPQTTGKPAPGLPGHAPHCQCIGCRVERSR